jgi:hypothetical protein
MDVPRRGNHQPSPIGAMCATGGPVAEPRRRRRTTSGDDRAAPGRAAGTMTRTRTGRGSGVGCAAPPRARTGSRRRSWPRRATVVQTPPAETRSAAGGRPRRLPVHRHGRLGVQDQVCARTPAAALVGQQDQGPTPAPARRWRWPGWRRRAGRSRRRAVRRGAYRASRCGSCSRRCRPTALRPAGC